MITCSVVQSSSSALEHCKYPAIMLYGLQHLGHHAQHAHTMHLVSQPCLIFYTARPPHQTRSVPSFPLAICNTLLLAQITLCQPAAHLLLHTCRPSVKISTSQSYHHVRSTCTCQSCGLYDVQKWHTESLLGFCWVSLMIWLCVKPHELSVS